MAVATDWPDLEKEILERKYYHEKYAKSRKISDWKTNNVNTRLKT